MKGAAASAGLAATTMWSAPAAAELDSPGADFGAYLSYTFGGPGGGFGLGLQARAYVRGEEVQCGTQDPIPYGAAALRLGLIGFTQPRLIVAAQGGVLAGEIYSAAGELGVGYRFGEHAGLETFVGADLGMAFAVTRVGLDPRREELALDLGVRLPSFDTSGQCYVIGRPLRLESGESIKPELRAGVLAEDSDELTKRGVAMWCDRARTEWASVPAFFELADQLIAVGAPQPLIDRAYHAASEEVRHAILSAGLASVTGGEDGAIEIASTDHAPRVPLAGLAGITRLAVESWVDGCLGEGLAARVAAAEAQLDAATPRIRDVQRSIARDEASHAELAWDILAYTLAREPEAVRAALAAVRDASRLEPDADPAAELARFGCIDGARRARITSGLDREASVRLDRLTAVV
jgi:hypothetical protein